MTVIEDTEWAKVANSYQENPEKALARMLHYCAMEGFEAHKKTLSQAFKSDSTIGSRMLVETYTEYLILFMHLINRKADEVYGRRNVAKIQSLLLPYIVENAQLYYDGDSRSILQSLMTIANDRERDYAKCKYWVPSKPDYAMRDMQSTQYVFQSKLESILSKEHNDPISQIEIMAECSDGLTSFFAFVNLEEWLKGLAMRLGITDYKSIDLAPPGIK